VIGKAIEDLAARVGSGSLVVLALVEESASFLAVMQIVDVLDAALARANFFRDFAVENRDALFEAFEKADFRIVALDDSERRKKLDEELDQHRFDSLHGLAEILHDEIVAVAIDDKRRDGVCFAVDEAVGFGICDGAFAEFGGSEKALAKKRPVYGDVLRGNEADGNLGAIAVKRAPVETAALIKEAHDGARFGINPADVTAINPLVARA
jgi:hypothetical protein